LKKLNSFKGLYFDASNPKNYEKNLLYKFFENPKEEIVSIYLYLKKNKQGFFLDIKNLLGII
jgi:hypothetical protein